MMFDLSIQNVQPNFGYFLNVTAIQRLHSACGIITEVFFKHMISVKSWFIKVKTKLTENFLFHTVCQFTGL
jgi:hypothetical protein